MKLDTLMVIAVDRRLPHARRQNSDKAWIAVHPGKDISKHFIKHRERELHDRFKVVHDLRTVFHEIPGKYSFPIAMHESRDVVGEKAAVCRGRAGIELLAKQVPEQHR